MLSPQHYLWYILRNIFTLWILLDFTLIVQYDSEEIDSSLLYDFIVVGGGTAGSTLAGRLAEERNWRILLLETGGEQSTKLKIPWFHLWLLESPHSWYYLSESQTADGILSGYIDKRSVWWRGRVIGGTGAINTMIYMRAHHNDMNHWYNLGNDDWSFHDCLPFYKKLENMTGTGYEVDDFYHGTSGPVNIERGRHVSSLQEAFLEAGRENGYPILDQNGYDQYGFSPFLFTIKDGLRWTTADAYLSRFIFNGKRNLNILLNSHVTRIIIRQGKAIGVEFIRQGKKYRLYCKKEVILSAGVLESPRLLMLSGIGPKKHLQEVNISVVEDVPGVGLNLQDHIASYGLTWLVNVSGSAYNPFLYSSYPSTYYNWKFKKTGPLAAPIGVEGNAFVASKYGNETWPDIQLTFTSIHAGYDGGTIYKTFLGLSDEIFSSYFSEVSYLEGYSIYPILSRPNSRGYIKLKSSNPFDEIIIQPNYLKNKTDLLILIEGMKIARKIGDSNAFRKYGSTFYSKPLPHCTTMKEESDEYWECWIKTLATTDHHPVGTCKMGPLTDPMAVVDGDLKVRGISNLRVVDGSVFPTLTSGNINIPIIMIAEKISHNIKKVYGNVG